MTSSLCYCWVRRLKDCSGKNLREFNFVKCRWHLLSQEVLLLLVHLGVEIEILVKIIRESNLDLNLLLIFVRNLIYKNFLWIVRWLSR